MKNERSKRWWAYVLCFVLAVTSLAGADAVNGGMAYAENRAGNGDVAGEGRDGSEGSDSAEPVVEPEKVASGVALTVSFEDFRPVPEENIINSLETIQGTIATGDSFTIYGASKKTKENFRDKITNNIKINLLIGDDKVNVFNEKNFKYGKEYSLQISYRIPEDYEISNDFIVCVKGSKGDKSSEYKLSNGNDLNDEQRENPKTVSVKLEERKLTITKKYRLEEYADVTIKLGKYVKYKDNNNQMETTNEIIFDADKENKIRMILTPKIMHKPEKNYKFSDNIVVKIEGDENTESSQTSNAMSGPEKVSSGDHVKQVKIVDGRLEILTDYPIVTAPKTVEIKKQGKMSGESFQVFRNCTGGDKANVPESGGTTGKDVEEFKETYNYKVDFTWNGVDKKLEELNKQDIKQGENKWGYSIQSVDDKKTLCETGGTILGYTDALDKFIVLGGSYKSKAMAADLFGDKTGIKITDFVLEKKDEKYLEKKKGEKGEISAVKYKNTKKGTIKMNVTEIKYRNQKCKVKIPVEMKMGLPGGTVTFKQSKNGKKITCHFSDEIEKLAKKIKKNGIKSMKIKIEYKKKKGKFKKAPAAVKRYFQLTVPKKERYVTSKKKFKVREFRAWIIYKPTEGKKVQVKMNVEGKFKGKEKNSSVKNKLS